MNNKLKYSLLALFIFVLIAVVSSRWAEVPEEKSDQFQKNMETFLGSRLKSITLLNKKVHFVGDDQSIGVGVWGKPLNSNFSLGESEKFQYIDHHSQGEFEVVTIGEKNVVLKYWFKEDERSVGGKVIKHKGEVTLPYRDPLKKN